jgi:3-dehydroquinate dehydratase-1
MPAPHRVKSSKQRPKLVGVVTNSAELRLAVSLSPAPDLFELRLDSLFRENNLERKARALRAPLIITARHPDEGGKHGLKDAVRTELLLRFLPLARYVDIELRSVRALRKVLVSARRHGVGTIISFHDFGSTPTLTSLRAKASQAARFKPAVFKVATRTDTPVQLGRLLQLFAKAPNGLSLSAMGIGRLGAVSRLLMAQCGSALVYTSLSKPKVKGQVSLKRFRTALRQIDRRD